MPFHDMLINPQDILNDLPGGFLLYEAAIGEKLLYANSETIRIFGCDSLEDFRNYIGNSFRGLVHPDDLERVEEEIEQQLLASPRNFDTVEYRIIRKDGEVRWLDDFGHLIHDKKWGDVFYVFITDITQRKQLEQTAADLAQERALQIDALTGLYSKDYFFKYADEIIRARPNDHYTILASDIENFRFINEAYGIKRGDEILKSIASIEKPEMHGLVLGGRIDGDRFVYLFKTEELSRAELLTHISATCRQFRISNLPVKYGIYRVEENIPIQAMCNRALLALDTIKGVYGSQFAVYSEDLRMDWIRRQQITASAEDSLRDRQFVVYFQPKHHLASNRTTGAEALVRWFHPEYGFMSPGIFIPLFEKNGFITKLDLYILEEVCRTLSQWTQDGTPVVPISINLSRRDLEIPGIANTIVKTVDSWGLPHELIHFEVTESCYTENAVQAFSCIDLLHQEGFAIELDDFGSGYSSLAALSSLPIDILKIDLSIIRQDNPSEQRNILNFIMQLAKIMKMETVQEGVETEEQCRRVKELGCDYVQGYFFSKPLPRKEFEDYLRKTIA